jgi:hypothetical protein
MDTSLDKFGAFFVQNLRDRMLYKLETLLRGHSKAPDLLKLQSQLSDFSDEQKQVLHDAVEEVITSGMHDLLFAIQEQSDADGAFKVLADGEEVAKLSDGLHGEIFGEDGWIARFSKYPCPAEIERSKWAKEFIAKMIARKDDHDDH